LVFALLAGCWLLLFETSVFQLEDNCFTPLQIFLILA